MGLFRVKSGDFPKGEHYYDKRAFSFMAKGTYQEYLFKDIEALTVIQNNDAQYNKYPISWDDRSTMSILLDENTENCLCDIQFLDGKTVQCLLPKDCLVYLYKKLVKIRGTLDRRKEQFEIRQNMKKASKQKGMKHAKKIYWTILLLIFVLTVLVDKGHFLLASKFALLFLIFGVIFDIRLFQNPMLRLSRFYLILLFVISLISLFFIF